MGAPRGGLQEGRRADLSRTRKFAERDQRSHPTVTVRAPNEDKSWRARRCVLFESCDVHDATPNSDPCPVIGSKANTRAKDSPNHDRIERPSWVQRSRSTRRAA